MAHDDAPLAVHHLFVGIDQHILRQYGHDMLSFSAISAREACKISASHTILQRRSVEHGSGILFRFTILNSAVVNTATSKHMHSRMVSPLLAFIFNHQSKNGTLELHLQSLTPSSKHSRMVSPLPYLNCYVLM